jgi:hypothetical protein
MKERTKTPICAANSIQSKKENGPLDIKNMVIDEH